MAKNTSEGAQSPEAKPQKVTITIPSDPLVRDGSGNTSEQQLFMSVNGKSILVKCDEPVEVDPEFAEVLRQRQAARRKSAQYIKETAFRDSEPPKG